MCLVSVDVTPPPPQYHSGDNSHKMPQLVSAPVLSVTPLELSSGRVCLANCLTFPVTLSHGARSKCSARPRGGTEENWMYVVCCDSEGC